MRAFYSLTLACLLAATCGFAEGELVNGCPKVQHVALDVTVGVEAPADVLGQVHREREALVVVGPTHRTRAASLGAASTMHACASKSGYTNPSTLGRLHRYSDSQTLRETFWNALQASSMR